MLKNLQDTIRALNADVNNVANCKRAKKLRKKLLGIGLPMAIGGWGCALVGFFLFISIGMDYPYITMPLFVIGGIIGSIGSAISLLGFKIVITGYTTDLVNQTVGNNCPNCGQTINPEMPFCSKCGTRVKKECPNCKHINAHTNEFCEKCGNKLN